MERQDNGLYDFTQAVASETSASNTMAANNRYSAITLNRSLLTSTYTEHGICQVFIDAPVDDAFRGGIVIKCDELSADDLKLIYSEMDKMEVLQTYARALKWMRLFGGAGILINIGQDLTKPFNIERIKEDTPLKFYAVDRWELSYSPTGMGGVDQFYEPATDHPYNYYGHIMHKSHVIKLNGKEAPSLIRGQFSGWGMSELEKIVRSFNQYLKHQSVTFEILDESKIDVFQLAGFNSAISTKIGAQKTAERVQMAAQIKNFQNALVLDKEDTYEQKTLNYAGLSEIIKEIRIGLACDLRMPMTKLFGISASGLNASAEEDIENYNSMIETEIRSKVKPGLRKMLNIVCQKLFGYVPESIDFEYHPLREQTAQERSIIKTEALNRIIQGFTNGMMTNEAVIEQINAANIFDLDLKPEESMPLEDLTNLSGQPEGGEAGTVGRSGRI